MSGEIVDNVGKIYKYFDRINENLKEGEILLKEMRDYIIEKKGEKDSNLDIEVTKTETKDSDGNVTVRYYITPKMPPEETPVKCVCNNCKNFRTNVMNVHFCKKLYVEEGNGFVNRSTDPNDYCTAWETAK